MKIIPNIETRSIKTWLFQPNCIFCPWFAWGCPYYSKRGESSGTRIASIPQFTHKYRIAATGSPVALSSRTHISSSKMSCDCILNIMFCTFLPIVVFSENVFEGREKFNFIWNNTNWREIRYKYIKIHLSIYLLIWF